MSCNDSRPWLTAAILLSSSAPWAPAAAQECATLKGHTASVDSVAFSPDGTTLATASADKTVRLWNVRTGESRAMFKGHASPVRSVVFFPDGKLLASGGGQFKDDVFVGEIKLWDAHTGELKQSWVLKHDDVQSLAFSPDGKFLASGGLKRICVWDVTAGERKRTLPTGDSAALAVAFSPDGRTLASGSFDTRLRLWDARTWKEKATLKGDNNEVRTVLFSPDGKTLFTRAGDSKEVYVREADAGKLKQRLKCEYEVFAVALAPNGTTLAIGTREGAELSKGRVELWDAESNKREQTLNGHAGPVTSLAFSPDGKTLASGSQDKTVKLWDVAKSLRRKPPK